MSLAETIVYFSTLYTVYMVLKLVRNRLSKNTSEVKQTVHAVIYIAIDHTRWLKFFLKASLRLCTISPTHRVGGVTISETLFTA